MFWYMIAWAAGALILLLLARDGGMTSVEQVALMTLWGVSVTIWMAARIGQRLDDIESQIKRRK